MQRQARTVQLTARLKGSPAASPSPPPAKHKASSQTSLWRKGVGTLLPVTMQGWQQGQARCTFLLSGTRPCSKHFASPETLKLKKQQLEKLWPQMFYEHNSKHCVLGRMNQPFHQLTSAAAAALPTPGDLHNGQSSDQPLWGHPCSCFHSTRSLAQYQKPKGTAALRRICT